MFKEDKVISLELAKQIDTEHKRLNIEVDSEWYWVNCVKTPYPESNKDYVWILRRSITDYVKKEYKVSAYDCSELGEMLADKCREDWYSEPVCGIWYCRLHTHNVKDSCTRRIEGDTEADARGKMYLWLLKEGHIKGEE